MGVTTTKNRFWALLVIFFAHFSFGKTAIPPSILVRTQNPKSRTKIRVAALVSRHSPKKAKIQEEPWKTTRTSEMKKIGVGSTGILWPWMYLWYALLTKNCSPKKYFLPQVSKFLGSKFDIFGPGGPAGQCFHERGVLLVPWYGDSKSCSSSPRKLVYLAPFSLDCMI